MPLNPGHLVDALFHHPFDELNFQDAYWPMLWASVILLVVAVILYNVNTRRLHRHPPLVNREEWLLWTAICVFGLLIVATVFHWYPFTAPADPGRRSAHVRLDRLLPLPAAHRGLQRPAAPSALLQPGAVQAGRVHHPHPQGAGLQGQASAALTAAGRWRSVGSGRDIGGPEGRPERRGITGQVIWNDRRAHISELAFPVAP